MNFEEKFEDIMKSYQAVLSSNLQLKNQNEYLGKQLDDVLKQKQKALTSPIGFFHGDEGEEDNKHMGSLSEEDSQGGHEGNVGTQLTLMTLYLKSRSLKVNLIQMSF